MQRIIISLIIVLTASTFGLGQHTQTTKNTVDQTLRSSGRVNTSTLGMEFDLPIGGYAGRGFDLPLGLSYSSKVWKFEEKNFFFNEISNESFTFVDGVYSENAAAGWTSSLAQPYVEYTGMTRMFDTHGKAYNRENPLPQNGLLYVRRITVFLPGGESHELRASDDPIPVPSPIASPVAPPSSAWEGTFYATDGSGIRFVQDSNEDLFRLYLPNGSYYDFYDGEPELLGSNYTSASRIRKAHKLTDVNGNFVQYNAPTEGPPYPYGSWTDQLGRTFPVMVPTFTHGQDNHMSELTDEFTLPGMDYPYELTWKRLATVFADNNYELRYIGAHPSGGSSDPLFPSDESVFASCNATGRSTSPNSQLHVRNTNWYFYGDEFSNEFNPMVLAEVKLPNGAAYKFLYNEYGEIEKIDYPFGGYEEFAYKKVDSVAGQAEGFQMTNRGVEERRVYESSAASPMTYTYSAASSEHNYRTSVTAPDGTQTDTFMHRGIKPLCDANVDDQYYYGGLQWGYDSPLAGRAWETRVFDSADNIKQRTVTRWIATTPTPNVPIRSMAPVHNLQWNARIDTTQTITYEGGSRVAAATKFEYGSPSVWGSPLNTTKKSEYAYETVSGSGSYTPATTSEAPPTLPPSLSDPTTGDTPVRVTWTTYETGTAYTNRNILRLPTEVLVTDGASTPNVKAKSQITYDGVSLLDESESTRWTNPNSTYRGLVTKTRAWHDIFNNLYIDTDAQYDMMGNLRKSWDGRGNLSQIEYSSTYDYAFPTKSISPIPDPNGTYGHNDEFETVTTYDFDSGMPLTVTDPNGAVTVMEYDDPMNRPTKVTAGYGTGNAVQTITEYGVPSSGTYPSSQRFVKVKSQIDSTNWKQAYTWFDGLGRTDKTQSVDDDGDVFVLTCYDSAGRLSKTSNPFRNLTSQTCATTNGANDIYWTTNTFDTAGRPWKVTTPDGAVVETTYSLATSGSQIGTVVTVEDQADKQRRSITNAMGQLVRVDEPTTSGTALGNIDSPNQPTYYDYDHLNNLKTVKQGGTYSSPEQTRTFTYDALSRLKSAANPESGTINYNYDSNGNLTSKVDARGITTTYTYDAINRVTQRSYATPNPTPSPNQYQTTPNVTYYYDNVTNAKGKLTKVTSSVSTTEYTAFDILGRVTAHKQTTDGGASGGYTTGYTYNLAGALIEETYSSGRVVKNVLDNTGDLSIVQSKKNSAAGYWNYADGFSYNAAGAVTSMQLGNGRWESTTFNSRLQPTQIALGLTPGATNLLDLDYEYGATAVNNGNVTKQTINVPTVGSSTGFSAVQTYNYDSLNRLKNATEMLTPIGGSATQTWKQTYIFDRYGNRRFDFTGGNTTFPASSCTEAICNPTISTTNNRITSSGWTYDAAGNTLTDANGQSYVYDGENKQVKASNGGGTLGEYFYDGDGKRVKKVVPSTGEVTVFVYDAAGKQIAEYSTIVEAIEDAKVAYLTADHLGSPRINTDRDGSVTARHDYHPFGEEILTTTQRTSGLGYAADSIRKQFTGYERDGESGLDFAQARHYSPRYGRFNSVDPVMLSSQRLNTPQAINLYVYVGNNPLAFIDPLGLDITVVDKTSDGTGSEEYKSIVNNRTGAKFKVGYDAKNKLVIVNEKGEALGKKELKALGKSLGGSEKGLFKAITDTSNHATVNLVRNDSDVFIGRHDSPGQNTIDLGDIANVVEGMEMTKFTLAGHETMESYYSVSRGKGESDAHREANKFFPGLINPELNTRTWVDNGKVQDWVGWYRVYRTNVAAAVHFKLENPVPYSPYQRLPIKGSHVINIVFVNVSNVPKKKD